MCSEFIVASSESGVFSGLDCRVSPFGAYAAGPSPTLVGRKILNGWRQMVVACLSAGNQKLQEVAALRDSMNSTSLENVG